MTAENGTNSRLRRLARSGARASSCRTPGGPQKTSDGTRSSAIARRRKPCRGRRAARWPTTSSSVRGRIRSASGVDPINIAAAPAARPSARSPDRRTALGSRTDSRTLERRAPVALVAGPRARGSAGRVRSARLAGGFGRRSDGGDLSLSSISPLRSRVAPREQRVDDRHEHQGEEGRDSSPPTTAMPSGRGFGAGAEPDRDRQDAEDRGERGHEDRPQADARRARRGLRSGRAPPARAAGWRTRRSGSRSWSPGRSSMIRPICE